MRALLQRVRFASVVIDLAETGRIERGLVVFLGIEQTDTAEDVEWLAGKIVNLRLFPDETSRSGAV